MNVLLCALLFGVAWTREPAPDLDEVREQLHRELVKHARRNSWPAVDDTYRRLVAVGLPPDLEVHVLGARAAMERGQALLAWHRLRRVPESALTPEGGPDSLPAEGARLLGSLREQYGMVSLYVPDELTPELVRTHLPFKKEERDVIAAAVAAVAKGRAYRGLLPEGEYQLAGLRFLVRPDWSQVKQVVADDPTTGDEAPPPAPSALVPAPE